MPARKNRGVEPGRCRAWTIASIHVERVRVAASRLLVSTRLQATREAVLRFLYSNSRLARLVIALTVLGELRKSPSAGSYFHSVPRDQLQRTQLVTRRLDITCAAARRLCLHGHLLKHFHWAELEFQIV
jgi:hypothetical protein